ncbi:hypothetical protein B0T19DRAFT_150959 [Cercophora scortea]|uniref:Uncharacterized protein n=1 Tax=Cercophora scortea TaxID=314031 RepID=A0AAE0IKY4_9PEZI|nr:hypothetical protein B0T19DRAFT_150959 [Cercophora scortea]
MSPSASRTLDASPAMAQQAGPQRGLPQIPISEPIAPGALEIPDVDEQSDCESEDESEDDRQRKPASPRDLEEGKISKSTSSSSLVSAQKEKAKAQLPLIPESDPFEYHGLDSSPLPPKIGSRFYRYLRWNFGSVYRRIFCLVFLGNAAALAVMIAKSATSGGALFNFSQAATATTANLLAALVVRNEHVVNALFWVFGSWSHSLPFWARKLVAKIYSYGGIHSGGAVAGTVWYIAYLVLLTLDFQAAGPVTVLRSYIYFVSYTILALLVTMLIFAHPHLRIVMHNWFEGIHRFMGWSVVLLFWAQTLLLTADSAAAASVSLGSALVVSPSFWMLVVITLLVIYPWTRMRMRDVKAEVLSQHCVKLSFDYRNVYYGQAVRLTDAPLKETHAFGVVPFPTAAPQPPFSDTSSSNTTLSTYTDPNTNKQGFSVYVSSAGDWTRKIIANPPTKIYTRGTPQFGILRVAGLFKPCVMVATGSGIAPCLSLFVQNPTHPVRIVWSTPAPLETYGRAVVDLIYRTDPRAVIIDTRKPAVGKRPDLVKIVYRVCEAEGFGKEGEEPAVVVISNQRVTRKVIYGLESRGVPAYGAIFDS